MPFSRDEVLAIKKAVSDAMQALSEADKAPLAKQAEWHQVPREVRRATHLGESGQAALTKQYGEFAA